MTYKRKLVWIILACFLLQIGYGLWNNTFSQGYALQQLDDVFYKITVSVNVFDVDQKTSYSTIEIRITLGPMPRQFNETTIMVQILGGGDMTLFCQYVASDSYGKYFEGNFSGSWYVIGAGELFPFDYYRMEFRIKPFIDANFTINQVFPIFHGLKQKSLLDTWETSGSYNEIPYAISNGKEPTLTLAIKRRCLIPFLAFVLPVILCYYFLAATLFLEPKSWMQEITTVYLSLFIFIPTFFIAIQEFLPYRSFLTIPEILLTNLVTSIGLFGVSTIVSAYRKTVPIRSYEIPLEWFSLLFALIFLNAYYLYLLLPVMLKFSSIEVASTLLFVVLSYIFGCRGFLLRWKKYEKEKEEKERLFWDSVERAHH